MKIIDYNYDLDELQDVEVSLEFIVATTIKLLTDYKLRNADDLELVDQKELIGNVLKIIKKARDQQIKELPDEFWTTAYGSDS